MAMLHAIAVIAIWSFLPLLSASSPISAFLERRRVLATAESTPEAAASVSATLMAVDKRGSLLGEATVLPMAAAVVETGAFGTGTGADTLSPDASASVMPLPNLEACSEPGPCELCTDSDRNSIAVCHETGRRQSWTCPFKDDVWISPLSSSTTASKVYTYYKSCVRTTEDDEFLFVRFQVVTLLSGLLAIMLVRKQKVTGASLFDQRRLNLQKHRSDNNMPPATIINILNNGTSASSAVGMGNASGAIELTSASSSMMSSVVGGLRQHEESKPLVSSSFSDNDGLDVV